MRTRSLRQRTVLPGKDHALFFDIDGTVFVKQLLVELMLACGRRFRSRRDLVAPIRDALRMYRSKRTYDYTPVIDAAVNAIPAFFTGLCKADVMAVARDVVRSMGGETYLFPRTVLQSYAANPLARRGLIVAVTGAPQEIAELFCKRLGFDLVYGVRYEVVNGRYTGIRDDRTVRDKGAVVGEIMTQYDLAYDSTVAFGDTMSDLSMFRKVRHQFAVNAKLPLLRAMASEAVNLHAVWVNDRQANGVSFFVWDPMDDRFVQVHQNQVLPAYLANIVPQLPGPPVHRP